MPVGLRDRRTWRRRGPPARTLVIGTDARCPHRRALLTPARVVDMSARYIPLAVSTTPSRCRQPPHNVGNARPCRQPPHNVDNARPCRQPPHSVDNARPRPCPENAPVRPRTAARRDYAPPRAWGIPSEGGEHHGTPRMPLVPGGCPIFCCSGRNETKDAPSRLGIACARPRVRGTPARARAGRSWRATRTPRRGNARTRARAGPRSGFPQVVRHPWGYAHKNPDLQNTHRAQGGDPALVRGPVFPNSLPCVRHREKGEVC